MAVVGLVVHGERLQAMELARNASRWLLDHGHDVKLPAEDADATGLSQFGVAEEELGKGLDLAVSLGGDGTMLRTVDLVAGDGAPVMTVDFARNVLGLAGANSSEFDSHSPHKVIDLMDDQREVVDFGGTMMRAPTLGMAASGTTKVGP